MLSIKLEQFKLGKTGGLMVIFSPRKLEQLLADEKLNAWEQTKYLILAVVVSALSEPLFWIVPTVKIQDVGLTALAQFIATILGPYITYLGIKKCYGTNNKDHKFVERFICLRVPWTVLFGLVLAPLSLTIIYVTNTFFPQVPDLANIILYICSPPITFIYYNVLNKSFLRIKSEQAQASEIEID